MKTRHLIAIIACSATLGFAAEASAAGRSSTGIKGWSAMDGIEPAALLHLSQQMPLSEVAVNDQPYCASHDEISQTLQHDFDEALVDATGHDGVATELWGSDEMGTWTLVAQRADATSCIIASGIGFSSGREAAAYYTVAGLRQNVRQ